MIWNRYLLGCLAVVLLTFVKSRFIGDSWPLDLSMFLTFFIIRTARLEMALIQVFLLGLGMDIILQAAHIKGLTGMGQLIMVYAIMQLKNYITPAFEDLFLFMFFAVFYIGNYYIGFGLSRVFGVQYEIIHFGSLSLYAGIHAALFAVMLQIVKRLQRRDV